MKLKKETNSLAFSFAVCEFVDMQHPRVCNADVTHDKNTNEAQVLQN